MPHTKLPNEPTHSVDPAHVRGLKDKAPPKPLRRFSSIPPALANSGTASRIPPAPRPPRPPTQQLSDGLPKSVRPKSSRNSRPNSSRPSASRPHSSRPKSPRPAAAPVQTWALEAGATERPVAAETPPNTPQRDSGSRALGAVAAVLFLGTLWFLREPVWGVLSPAQSAASKSKVSAPLVITLAPVAARATRRAELDARAPVESAVALPELPAAPQPRQAPPGANDSATTPAAESAARPSAPAGETEADRGANSTAPSVEEAVEAPAPAPALPAFDAAAAKRALGQSALSASSCRKGDDPRGTAEVIVTFAPSGRVTSANVNGAPYGGTATGGCIAETLRGASVPPFAGRHVTVRKLVTVR